MKQKKEHDLEFLEKLLMTAMPSGYETIDGAYLIRDYLSRQGNFKEILNTSLGSFAYKQGNGPKKILISAHYDEIGFQVQHINSNGLINIVPIGGLDKKVLAGQVVEIYTRRGDIIPGVIGKKPIHAESADERSGYEIKMEDFLVDIGATDDKDAKSMISIGDYGVIKSTPILNFGNKDNAKRLMGRGLDDKIGMYIVTQVAKYLGKMDFDKYYTIIYAGFPQEETGLRGAIQVKDLNPDVSIDIDVMFATDEGRGISEAKNGVVNLGNGVVINHGVDKNYDLNYSLIKVAEKEGIPYQEIVTQSGVTNTEIIQLMSRDCITTHLSLGIRNLHTPVEICDWDDIESTIDLICKAIENKEI